MIDRYSYQIPSVNETRCSKTSFSRLESLVSIPTSQFQAIDSRRSLIETIIISRLTYLALSFIPLTFVSGLFSMNDNIASGGKFFGLYFAVSTPLCTLVFLIVRPPTTTPAIFTARIWRKVSMLNQICSLSSVNRALCSLSPSLVTRYLRKSMTWRILCAVAIQRRVQYMSALSIAICPSAATALLGAYSYCLML